MTTAIVRRWKMLGLALLFAAAVLGAAAPGAVSAVFHSPVGSIVRADNNLPPCCPPTQPKCPGNTIWG